ncbi:hypothetical protein BDC45DRAFT_281178 [Circinella umbellata]|nr:hypothetical protein BDC45DRAFT_281178 [Circinella umbellata]
MAKKRGLISALPFGADLEIRGPPENKLFQLDHIYNRNEYPTVHALADEWTIVNESEATSYLPGPNTRKITIGIKEQETAELPVGATLNLYKHMQSKRGFVLNLGCSVLGLEFAPKRPEVDTSPHTQYLAISGFRGAEGEHHLYNEVYPEGTYKNSISIWRCELSIENTETDPVLDLCLLHDYGPVKELKWCPYGAYDESSEEGWPKLGLLAIVCSDNSVRVLVVPHPRAVRESIGEMDSSKVVYIKISKARQTFRLNNMIPMTTNWGGSDKLTCGYTNGR